MSSPHTQRRHAALPRAAAARHVKAGNFDARRREAYALLERAALQQAEQAFTDLSEHESFSVEDWVALSRLCYWRGRHAPCCAAASRALALDEDDFHAAKMLTLGLLAQNRTGEAIPWFKRHAAGRGASDYNFLVDYGAALSMQKRHGEALDVYLRAMVLKVSDPAIHMRVGLVLKELKMYSEAAESFLTACTLEPSRFAARLMVMHMRQYACQWTSFESDRQGIVDAMKALEAEENPRAEGAIWALSAIEHPPVLFRKAAAQVAAKFSRGMSPLPARRVLAHGSRRVRVGYLSSDFQNHATALLLVEVLESRDRDRFEVVLYSHGRDDGSEMRRRIVNACDRFVDMCEVSVEQMASEIHRDGIDILVDLKGHTFDNRFEVLAHRPAPIQVAWLGFPGTCGADYVDYMIGDRWVTPLAHADHFTERLAQMPHCYQPNDSKRPRPAASTRQRCALPEDVPVMGCFNQSFKIAPDTFAAWMRVMHAVPTSVLWLLYDNEQACQNLRAEAVRAGIAPERLFFAPRLAVANHLARLPVADLMVDNWPCNAHTTASDALWMGVPIVTLVGEGFSSRVAGSLLHSVGLGPLACQSVQDYEQTIIRLLSDRTALQGLRNHLAQGRTTFPLFDGARFARDLEALYLRMVDRAVAGLAPAALPAHA